MAQAANEATVSEKLEFDGSFGARLAARLDRPTGETRAYALFAHCFTCSKDIFAARTIAAELAAHGIATVRFDFTGLGSSQGEFASTNFSSNVEDLLKAVDHMRERGAAPSILVGHSLGGAAVLAAAGDIPEVRAVATIGAPADAEHVVHNFHAHLDRIEETGEAEVELAGRTFTIRKQFLDDLRNHTLTDRVHELRRPLLVLHAPLDATVGIDNASAIFMAARHPKSFVSLDRADHLLSRREDARYAASVIAAWASRYLGASAEGTAADADRGAEPARTATRDHASAAAPLAQADLPAAPAGTVRARNTGRGRFQTALAIDDHALLADEPAGVGGANTGPTPYDLVSMGLAACTVMTLLMYAERKGWSGLTVTVDVDHAKVHAADCEDCTEEVRMREGRIDRFERRIAIAGEADPERLKRLLEIADRCPVHRTLEHGAAIVTHLAESADA